MLSLFGISLFSSWLNLVLYTAELALVILYFCRHPKDVRWLHAIIIIMSLADTIATLASCATTWTFLIVYELAPIMNHLWTMPVIVITTAVSAVLEQFFLIYRIYTLSKGRLVCGFLGLLAITHVTFTVISAVYLVIDTSFEPNFGITATTVAFCIETAVDILIPVALLWQLRKVNSSFTATKSLIRQISLRAVSSGVVVALIGIIFLALFWTHSMVFVVITNFHGRVYTLTVLVSLLARKGPGSKNNTDVIPPTIDVSRLFDIDLSIAGGSRSILPVNSGQISSTTGPSSIHRIKENLELLPSRSRRTADEP